MDSPKNKQQTEQEVVAVVGAGPAGMTIALLLARAGHKVKLYEASEEIGGLWSVNFSEDGHYLSENSCKVYQGAYHTAPALFELIGTKWQDHFISRYNLKTDWIRPFLKDCTIRDYLRFGLDLSLDLLGLKSFKKISVEEYLANHKISEGCQSWLRATALGGITGTLKMSMWELGYRFRYNFFAIYKEQDYDLFWNKQPPNSEEGFVAFWEKALIREGVEIHKNSAVDKLLYDEEEALTELSLVNGLSQKADVVFLATAPPCLSKILEKSSKDIIEGFGHNPESLKTMLEESIYQHLGIAWFFDKPLPEGYPLGGYSVRKGWYPILVPFPQYAPFLKPNYSTVVVGSVSLVTDFVHPRLGKKVSEYSHQEIAKILWEDERAANPDLPEAVDFHIFGLSSATQIVHHGSLPLKSKGHQIYLGTNINGEAPYFTSSLESAIQAGFAAASSFDLNVETLPTGS